MATRYNHVMPPNGLNCEWTTAPTWWKRGAYSASSRHPGVVNVLFGDGTIRAIKASVSNATWWAIGTMGAGEVVSADAY